MAAWLMCQTLNLTVKCQQQDVTGWRTFFFFFIPSKSTLVHTHQWLFQDAWRSFHTFKTPFPPFNGRRPEREWHCNIQMMGNSNRISKMIIMAKYSWWGKNTRREKKGDPKTQFWLCSQITTSWHHHSHCVTVYCMAHVHQLRSYYKPMHMNSMQLS